MGNPRRIREPLPLETFEQALEEEMSVSAEFDLPLTLLSVRAEEVLDSETARRLLGTLRAADLVTRSTPGEFAIALPNTGSAGARAVERRLREVLPHATIGGAAYGEGDEVHDLLQRARSAEEI
jgi:hypothetical protein